MPAYIPITEPETDPGAPGTSELWKKWRDNPLAIAEGATGAPKVKAAARSLDRIAYVATLTGTTYQFIGLPPSRAIWAYGSNIRSSVNADAFLDLSSDNGATWSNGSALVFPSQAAVSSLFHAGVSVAPSLTTVSGHRGTVLVISYGQTFTADINAVRLRLASGNFTQGDFGILMQTGALVT